MPYNPTTNTFTRALVFVDDRLPGNRVTRGDLDAAFLDVAGGISAVAADAAAAATQAARGGADTILLEETGETAVIVRRIGGDIEDGRGQAWLRPELLARPFEKERRHVGEQVAGARGGKARQQTPLSLTTRRAGGPFGIAQTRK